jgi:hypothetical protein
MTVSSEVNKSGPYNGNGVTTVFDYDFKIVDEDHLKVIKTVVATGVETVLTIDTHYVVSDVGNPLGGQVAILSAPATGEAITILRNVPFVQETDLENQGAYFAETVEAAFDLATMRDQQLAEEIERSVKIPASADPSTLESLIEDVIRLADSADNIDIVAGIEADVSAVAGIAASVPVVAGVADEVVIVAGIAAEVVDVAGVAADIPAVAANVADITNFADIYQGPKAADPATRNNGSALQPGDMYFSTMAKVLRVYAGAAEIPPWRDGAAQSLNLTPNSFTGNGVNTIFPLSAAPVTDANVLAWVGGVRQTPTTDYTVSGTSLTFAVAPANGAEIETLVIATSSVLNEPANDSVTDIKVAAGAAIQSTKLAYSNTASKLAATTVQGAIDELALWSISLASFNAVGNGVADDTVPYNNFIAAVLASRSKRGYIPAGTYKITAQPADITSPIILFGDGMGRSTIERTYNGTAGKGFLAFGPGSNGSVVRDLTIRSVAGTSGGAILSIVATAGGAPPSFLTFENLYLTTAGSDTHVNTVYIDGTPRVTAPIGVRDISFKNVHVFGSNGYSMYLAGVIGFSFTGGGVYPAGGTNAASGGVQITGNGTTVNSQYVTFDIVTSGGLNLTNCADMQLRIASIGAVSGTAINNAGSCTWTAVYGHPNGTVVSNWVNSGIYRPTGFATS